MAINYNINPYGGGNVVFDERPYLAFYERQKVKEQAKNDALENYFKDLNKNVTSAGMRSQDIPTLLQKNKEWQDHYIQNKAAILNPKLDNGAAYTKYMNGYQDQLAVTNESKEAQKKAEQLGKLKFNKDSSYIFDDPEITKAIESDALPIGDPNRTPLDINTMVRPPKPIDMKDREAFSKYAVGELKPDEIRGTPINIGNFQTQTPVTNQYSDQNKKTIGQRAADVYDTDRNWRAEAGKMFKEQVLPDMVLHNQLNAIHKKYFGTEVDSPRDAFIAKTILDHDVRNVKYEKGENEYGKQLALENIRFGHQKKLKEGEQKVVDNWITGYWDKRISDAKSGPPSAYQGPEFVGTKGAHKIELDGVAAKALARNGIEPSELYITQDNKLLPIFYEYQDDYDANGKKIGTSIKRDDNGNPVADKEYSKPISMDQAYLSMGYKGQTKKDLSGTMQGAYGIPKNETKKGANKVEDLRKKYNY